MNTARNTWIIGLSTVSLTIAALTGCQSGRTYDAQALDQREPWVKRDRQASLDFALDAWTESESHRAEHLRELKEDVRKRYERSVEDFYEIPVTAYVMFY